MTEVVAALIWKGEKFMICQRPAHKARGLLWEFVGGKVELGETKEQALIRECKEELNILLSVGDVFMDVIHEYPDLTVHLTLFNATLADGEPQKLEHNDIQWITPSEIPNYEFCPADEEILKKLYQYRCQICGATATVMYGVDVSEAHHIDFFTKSANNNPGNIIILCPDHHRIVHKAKAVFNFDMHQFEYENAKVDTLMYNLHL